MPYVMVQRRKVYYEIHGDQAGVPLVLVMGMGGSCRGWLPLQVPDFSAEHRTLIFEHRGVGESEDPGEPFSTADLADGLGRSRHLAQEVAYCLRVSGAVEVVGRDKRGILYRLP